MVNQRVYSFKLLPIVRIIAIVLVIVFFLPWFVTWVGPLSGFEFVAVLISNLFRDATTITPQNIIVGVGWGFIPLGAVAILVATYSRRSAIPLLSVLTGIAGIIPFFLAVILNSDVRQWLFTMFVTVIGLLTLTVIGFILFQRTKSISLTTPL